MKRLWFILLLVSCTIAPKINYEGDVNDEGKWHGKGVITYSNGEKWVGEFKDGKYDGLGTYTLSNGETYIGEFKNNVFDGKGVLYELDGDTFSGLWEESLFQGEWTVKSIKNYLSDKYPQFKGLENN